MDHDQVDVKNASSSKIPFTAQENDQCCEEKSFKSGDRELIGSSEEESSCTSKPFTRIFLQKYPALFTEVIMEPLDNSENCPQIYKQRQHSAERKDIDSCFDLLNREIADSLEEGMTLTEEVVHSIRILSMEVLDTLTSRAARLLTIQKNKTLTMYDLRMAVELTLPSNMVTLAHKFASSDVNFEIYSRFYKLEFAKKKDNDSSFAFFIREIADNLELGMTLTEEAIHDIRIASMEVLDTLTSRAARLLTFQKNKTLTMYDLRMAIELTLPSNMATLAIRFASSEVKCYKFI